MLLTASLFMVAWMLSDRRLRRLAGSETIVSGAVLGVILILLLYTDRLR